MRYKIAVVLLGFATCFSHSHTGHGATIAVDSLHGFEANVILSNGSRYDQFRATITGLGHTIVPLGSFSAGDLAAFDAVVVTMPYTQNAANYTPAQIAALHSFAQRAVFVSDSSLWSDDGEGADSPIGFGDNRQLLINAINFVTPRGMIVLGEDGDGFIANNLNALTAPYGIVYSGSPTDAAGRTVSGIVPHVVTAGVGTIGVDFHLPMTISLPSLDLTVGGGQDNVLAVFPVPEPATLAMGTIGLMLLLLGRRRRGR